MKLYPSWLCWLLSVTVALTTPPTVTDAQLQSACETLMAKLESVSDSGIYSTLSVVDVLSHSTESGVFHDNLVMQVKLASPYMVNPDGSVHTVVVMYHKEDPGATNVAIDEFPVMDEIAIGMFQQRQQQRNKQSRDAFFRQVEHDYVHHHLKRLAHLGHDPEAQRNEMELWSVKMLRQGLALPAIPLELAKLVADVLEDRLDRLEQVEAMCRETDTCVGFGGGA